MNLDLLWNQVCKIFGNYEKEFTCEVHCTSAVWYIHLMFDEFNGEMDMFIYIHVSGQNIIIIVFSAAEDESSESSHFITDEDPSQKLKWQAHLEFTQNQELGELTWDKVSKLLHCMQDSASYNHGSYNLSCSL